jgi:hypothetical protein
VDLARLKLPSRRTSENEHKRQYRFSPTRPALSHFRAQRLSAFAENS